MSAAGTASESIDRYLDGKLTVSELQQDLRSHLVAKPSDAAVVAAYLDELLRRGRLVPQVHELLMDVLPPPPAANHTLRRPEVERLRDGERAGHTLVRRPNDGERVGGDTLVRRPDDAEQAGGNTLARPPQHTVARRPERTRVRTADDISPAALDPDTGSSWVDHERSIPRDDSPPGPGSVIDGRYVLETLLGQGGMGVVYKALDRRKQETRNSAPYVAIKILNEEFRHHPDALVALDREASKAQALAHENIIAVHHFDRDGTTVFMTMQLLEGETLSELIEESADGVPKEKVLPMIQAMAVALAYAHKKEVVHSDFKPGNVFLTTDNEIKVLDFGIARAVPSALRPGANDAGFDASEFAGLTPAYASPEMLEGAAPVPADDVFALGVIAYELLTGRHPFDAARRRANVAQQRGLAPVPITGISRRQRRALTKALAFERADRQADARVFLREFVGPTRVKKWVYAAMFLLAAGLGYQWWVNSQLQPDVAFEDLPPDIQRSFNQNAAEGQRALGFGDVALNDAFEYFSRAYALHRNNPRAIKGLKLVADRFLASMSGADAVLQESVLRKLYCQEYLRNYDRVETTCRAKLGTEQCSVAGMECPALETEP